MGEIELLALAERVEGLEGADAEFDRLIANAVGWKHRSGKDWALVLPWERPEFTASLDAAATLVPDGWEGRLVWTHDMDGKMVHYVKGHGGHKGYGAPHYATPALALCAAALRAIASQEGK